ncbi:MAG: hypothetical protein GY945_09015 [Rhodobacteraceae bacterium]|nr:hypothetical protein [Paracoccaceae bacterium]
MQIKVAVGAFAVSLLYALPSMTQDGAGSAPLSAIDWLSNSVATPAPTAIGPATVPFNQSDVTQDASVENVTVSPLGRPMPDAVGILPASVTGLPNDLWGDARPEDLVHHIRAERADMLPALQELLYTLLLAELNPAQGVVSGGYEVFLARVDKLLELGALEQADALLARAGPENPEIFRRWFDVALLLGNEAELCAIMRATPELSPTFTARVFCLARGGDWNAAVLTLGTGRALGFISAEEDALLARFLDPDLFEGQPTLPRPTRPSPLTFRMHEAIGEPIATAALPLAFAQSDLRANIGWKARLEAGERLARTGAVRENQLLGLYTERRPAASGGVWQRVAAVQALDNALKTGNKDDIAATLPQAWKFIQQAELEVPFARVYGQVLVGLELADAAAPIALTLGLLSDEYEAIAVAAGPTPGFDLLLAVARGQTSGINSTNAREQAVLAGFASNGPPARLASLIETARLGEAILRAMTLFTGGTRGDLDEITDALALFRSVGLENTARRAALQYLMLERRG